MIRVFHFSQGRLEIVVFVIVIYKKNYVDEVFNHIEGDAFVESSKFMLGNFQFMEEVNGGFACLWHLHIGHCNT